MRQLLTLCPQSGSREMNGCSRPQPMEVCRLHLRSNCPHQSTQCRKSLRHAQRLVSLELLHPVKMSAGLLPHLHGHICMCLLVSFSTEQNPFFPSPSHLSVLTRSIVHAGPHPMILLPQPPVARITDMYYYTGQFGL